MGLVMLHSLHSMSFGDLLRSSCAPSALLATTLVVSACAGSGEITTASLAPPPETGTTLGQRVTRDVSTSKLADLTNTQTEAKKMASNEMPTGSQTEATLKKARQLRLSGQKANALKTLDAAENSETSPALVKERGMLALELGQLSKAEKLLSRARDEQNPDWRVHSALGAAYSARGNQQAAQLEFSKALKLAPDHPSVLNNLALSYALDGNHDQAERLLRRAAKDDKTKPKTKQNLALILGLNGNIKEARRVSSLVMPRDKAEANTAYFASRKLKSAKVSRVEKGGTAEPIRSARAQTTAQGR